MTDFGEVFKRLKGILEPYAEGLVVTADNQGYYCLESSYSPKWKKPMFFGSAKIQKNYVSFYLMPVYMFPELLVGISPGLKSACRASLALILRGWMRWPLPSWRT